MAELERQPCTAADVEEFYYLDGALHCESVAISDLVRACGTPLYVYSAAVIRRRFLALRGAFGAEARICYAVKSNPNLGVLRLFADLGAGFDLVSGGELLRLQAAGVDTRAAVFAGVAKQDWEVRAAIEAGILLFNVESPYELGMLSAAGAAAGARVPIALRVNPDVDADTHAYIRTGRKENKFGLSLPAAGEVVAKVAADPHLQLLGYHVHLGSQLRSVEPYVQALRCVEDFVDADPARGDGVRYYDLGGGFGIAYGRGEPLDVDALAAALLPRLRARGWSPILEPGRYLVGDAGILVTSVLGEKQTADTAFLLVDAAMNDLIRPALYQAEHPMAPVVSSGGAERVVDVVGPVCETGDFLARGRALPPLAAGDLLAVFAAGAYGSAMASNYNSRTRPAEVLVDGGEARLIRRRERPEDLWAAEVDLR